MSTLARAILFAVLGVALGACGDLGHGPARVAWDRDACEHCQMVISDRRYAAQLRMGETPHRFDDLGCALAWLDEQRTGEEPREIWVMDQGTQQWIDARTAFYRGGQRTPMAYGFGADARAAPGLVDLSSVRARLRARREESPRGAARP